MQVIQKYNKMFSTFGYPINMKHWRVIAFLQLIRYWWNMHVFEVCCPVMKISLHHDIHIQFKKYF